MPYCQKHHVRYATYGDCPGCLEEKPTSISASSPLMVDMVDALRRIQPAIIVLRDILHNAELGGVAVANYWITATEDLVERYEAGQR